MTHAGWVSDTQPMDDRLLCTPQGVPQSFASVLFKVCCAFHPKNSHGTQFKKETGRSRIETSVLQTRMLDLPHDN
jgi:hypothetical protein